MLNENEVKCVKIPHANRIIHGIAEIDRQRRRVINVLSVITDGALQIYKSTYLKPDNEFEASVRKLIGPDHEITSSFISKACFFRIVDMDTVEVVSSKKGIVLRTYAFKGFDFRPCDDATSSAIHDELMLIPRESYQCTQNNRVAQTTHSVCCGGELASLTLNLVYSEFNRSICSSRINIDGDIYAVQYKRQADGTAGLDILGYEGIKYPLLAAIQYVAFAASTTL